MTLAQPARRYRHRGILLAVVAAGLAVRAWLAFVVYPGQGFAGDLGDFFSWAQGMGQRGPAHFYAGDATANYPPVYPLVLWALYGLSRSVGALLGIAPAQALLWLLKLPAILADAVVALLVYRLAGRWFGGWAGVFGAALYLAVPVTWYDSAVWGQVDAVLAAAALGAVVCLVERRDVAAASLAALAVLVKPQGLICLVVVVPVLVRRHMIEQMRGPDGIRRLVIAAAAAGLCISLAVPFDLDRFAPRLQSVPVLGDLAGLVGLSRSTAETFPVLTANAYNVWALGGPVPLVRSIGTGRAQWWPDSMPLVAGVSAAVVGAVLLLAIVAAVVGGLLRRDGDLPIVLGFSVVAVAFFAVPTRVHERYLFTAFASTAVLAAGGLTKAASYLGAGLLNTVNLHAILAGPLWMGVTGSMTPGRATPGSPGASSAGPRLDSFGSGPGPPGPGLGTPARGITGPRPTGISLPLVDLARSPIVATIVVVGHTLMLAVLLAAWCLLVLRQSKHPTGPDLGRFHASVPGSG